MLASLQKLITLSLMAAAFGWLLYFGTAAPILAMAGFMAVVFGYSAFLAMEFILVKQLNKSDPGIRYQLFIAYSRTKQKVKADVNFAEFKRLEALTAKTGASATSRDNNEKIPDSVLVDKP